MSRWRTDPSALPGSGERVIVIGLGLSGLAAARHLVRLGATVTVTDASDDPVLQERAAALGEATVMLGMKDPIEAVRSSDLVVVSPGVPERAPSLEAAAAAGIPVWSEIELAFRLARAPILGVTGTNGKTTVTRMVASALTEAGYRAASAGNIGVPLTDAAVEDHDVIVAELSSFQLRNIIAFRAPVGVVLNVADDHLDWHGDFENYLAAKARLFENQLSGDVAIHHDDDASARAVSGAPGRTIVFSSTTLPPAGAGVDRDGWIVVPEGRVCEAASLRARGAPSLANAVAAAAVACAFGATPDAAGRALASFEPLPHRMELVATIGGVAYVNDSKATNPHAVLAALGGLARVVLIAGGRNKGLDLSPLGAAAGSVRSVIVIGESAAEVERAFAGSTVPVERAGTMDEAVAHATAAATAGDTVLLSPGCASFDMFADYKARGEAFRAAVKRIGSTAGSPAKGGM